jgi:hypothetical protein
MAVGAGYADDQEYPVTAADAARMTPPSAGAPALTNSPSRAAAPAAKVEPKYYDPTPLMMSAPVASAPVKVMPASSEAMPASPPAPIANAPVAAIPASSPVPLVAAPAPEASPSNYSALPASVPLVTDESDALARPTFAAPAVPEIDNRGNDAALANPEIQEIPQAMPQAAAASLTQPAAAAMTQPNQNPLPDVDDLHAYMNYDASAVPGLGSPDGSIAEGEEVSPIGMELRESQRRLKTGETAGGLLIVKVEKDSAAERAGLRPYKRAEHTVLEGIAIGAAMVFPPAILAVPVIDYSGVGESYDMIIGVDGSRVCNVLDFEDRMRNIQPGQTVYFNVVRNGKRMQVAVPITGLSTVASP